MARGLILALCAALVLLMVGCEPGSCLAGAAQPGERRVRGAWLPGDDGLSSPTHASANACQARPRAVRVSSLSRAAPRPATGSARLAAAPAGLTPLELAPLPPPIPTLPPCRPAAAIKLTRCERRCA